MTRLFDQISDMQKTLESLEDRVYSGQAAVSGLVTRDNDADDDDDDRGQFALIFFVILFVIIMTWVFLCCFYCLLRNRETVQSRQLEAIKTDVQETRIATRTYAPVRSQTSEQLEMRDGTNTASQLVPRAE